MRRMSFLAAAVVVACTENPDIARPLEATVDEDLLRVTPSHVVKRIVLTVLVIAGSRALLKGFGI